MEVLKTVGDYWVTLIVGVGALIVMWRKVWPVVKNLDHFTRDWFGEPARPGFPGRKGFGERLQSIENHLNTISVDEIRKLKMDVEEIKTRITTLERNTRNV